MIRPEPPARSGMPQAERLFLILTRIQTRRSGRPLGRPQLAEECGCDVRTIQRELNLLRSYFPQIEWDRHEQAYVCPEKDSSIPSAPLQLDDAFALTLLAAWVRLAPGLFPQAPRVRAALDKTTARLAPALRKALAAADALAAPSGTLRNYSDAPVLPLLGAIQDRITVQMDYTSAHRNSREWRTIDPYAIEPRLGIFWEVHGWCHQNQAIRTFALDNVNDVDLTDQTFTVREAEWAAFRLATGVGGMRGGAPVAVDVWFHPQVAAYVERGQHWPDTLTVTRADDGSATLRGTVAGTAGMVNELLRWRRYAVVRGGSELRAQMAAEIREMAGHYGEEGGVENEANAAARP